MSRRRGSSVSGATPKLQRRLEIRKIFNTIDNDGSGTVTISEFEQALRDFPSLQKFFASKGDTAKLFEELDTDGNDEVSWSEFLVFLEKLETEPNTNVSDLDFAKFFKDMNVEEGGEKEKEKALVHDVVMEVTFYNGEISVEYMSEEDTRVALEPDNKIKVNVDTNASAAAAKHVQERDLDKAWEEIITTEIHKAAIYACQQSLDTMAEAKKEISEKLLLAGKKILDDEQKYLDRVKIIKDRELEQKKREMESKAASVILEKNDDLDDMSSTGFHGEAEVEEFLKNRSPIDIPALNDEMDALRVELEEMKRKEEEQRVRNEQDEREQKAKDDKNRRRSSVHFDTNAPTTSDASKPFSSTVSQEDFGAVDADGDGKISRDEWRLWADAEITFLEQANTEKMEIMAENKRLRQALTKPSLTQQEEFLQVQDLEMAELNDQVVELQFIQDQLEAELAISSST
eukprot:CAMPEP_0182454682 /NCGR_PEP_ID=MMETSP1319-20130603/1209_1 /TAXON_ID=172717 /ORGANISM="Bolidomonas pacifica, Strain RCC208" /LENGTH=458 /DNA_ID=CAMNT_0024652703 /DNA_START=14 /DNA_END=1387 /DNA_ORIENTATION=-